MPATRLLSAMVATWNNVATTFTGLKFNVTDTASAAGSLLMDLQVGGASKFSVNKFGQLDVLGSLRTLGGNVRVTTNSGLISIGASSDVILARDAANTLALRNGTAAQKFSVYNTYTDASNYERGVFDWTGTANTLRIGTEAAGTGTVRNIQLVAGSNTVTMTPGASNLLTLNGGLTTGGTISGTNIEAGAGSALRFAGRGRFISPADGIIRATNAAETDFTRLILGTNDASGVSLKKSGTQLQVRLGDDTGDAGLAVGTLTAGSSITSATYVKTTATTVGALGSASTAGAGARRFVTDANATTAAGIGTVVVGGGSNKVPVYSDGTDWLIG